MYPHPVYIPTGEIRELRMLLTRRRLILIDRNRRQHRARSVLRASGLDVAPGGYHLTTGLAPALKSTEIEAALKHTLELCQRQQAALGLELRQVDAELCRRTQSIEPISRLQTIPGVGVLTATTIYAVGRLAAALPFGSQCVRDPYPFHVLQAASACSPG